NTIHCRELTILVNCFSITNQSRMTLTVGQKATRRLTLTSDHVKTFAALTGDYNPLHFDEAFTAKTKFKHLVVQGGLTTGLLHPFFLLAKWNSRRRLNHCFCFFRRESVLDCS